ncbi:hypothetical protein MAPG_04761 [Magnaporthiopsis poae ATCC 64411]|uniref:PLD phosphodiesterase domain-containing protein n=1 Tax=Magnaporthiopsis poae (strain ATCC 64411 / 73-15) TaxID=644358 RepID=A0A0C4DXK7_MAGP6|nr:hypothetical protein MAPG_04761 [Magnaporthiopsis poae ATCC 64411]
MTSLRQSSFAYEFVVRLQNIPLEARRRQDELPRYDYADDADLGRLVTTSRPRSFTLGTGASIYTSTLLPALLHARHEAILVTCFWAPSKTLDALRETLETLATHRRRVLDQGAGSLPTLRVRIRFSSRSFMQRLLHTSSRRGYTYPPSKWASTLGLPDELVLKTARIELDVKSLFFLPFSVMHPKFLIVDRHRAFLPSCNVSWEPWLEGCVELEGDAVDALLHFYARTWDPLLDVSEPLPIATESSLNPEIPGPSAGADAESLTVVHSTADTVVSFTPAAREEYPDPDDLEAEAAAAAGRGLTVETTVLPSSHHRNPRFRPFPWQIGSPPPPPQTPLNVAVLQLLDGARHQVYTEYYRQMLNVYPTENRGLKHRQPQEYAASPDLTTLEDLSSFRPYIGEPGKLHISYFGPPRIAQAKTTAAARGRSRSTPLDLEMGVDEAAEEPVHPHIKLTLVDGRYALLGSGNMDRASFYTSQELGVLFRGAEFVGPVKEALDRALDGRLSTVFDSTQQ